jgi:crossover junction endodeoxyribonuclease RuvC
MRLLGLDPGLRATGWGVIDATDNRLRWVADGVVRSKDDAPLAERLAQLYRGLVEVIDLHRPTAAAVEETFVNVNPASTLKLGQARGAVLLAASLQGLVVAEYAPRLVKQSLVGTGRAAKEQVGAMVRHLLPGCLARQADATDALAVAICHAHHHSSRARIQAALERAS